jgi:Mn-dependent DtxR family transcriptional regulator
MNNSMPSVCAALARLKAMGLVEYEKYDHIEFTDRGESIGYRISRKFDCLCEFLAVILMLQGPTSAKWLVAWSMVFHMRHSSGSKDCSFF